MFGKTANVALGYSVDHQRDELLTLQLIHRAEDAQGGESWLSPITAVGFVPTSQFLLCDIIGGMTSMDEQEAHRAEYERLQKMLKNHPGKKADQLMADVQRTFRPWYQRSVELRALLHHGETDENMQNELMRNIPPLDGREQYVGALDSALIAYLGAMGAVIDVARRVAKTLGNPFEESYNEQSMLVRAIDGVTVLRDLRNYMLHYGSAPWPFSGRITPDTRTTEVGLTSEVLAEWKGWKADSRAYLNSRKSVRLISVVAPYEAGMVALFEWFNIEFYRVVQPDLDAANKLVRQLNLHLTGGVTDGKDWPERMAHIQENLRRSNAGLPQFNYETGLPFPDDAKS
ncbi:hypothetical protein [Cryobacterium aureum]|uniref:hypothetical protein n=1 Tax=Cryobacterium aureum TaxID=995037 RepID=UPI000CF4DB35|nr:hypothetical protein [Cryobacterium aureum]